jgi:hypothetical protein
MKKLTLLSLLILASDMLLAQGTGINTASPDPSAALEVAGTDKGVLFPQVFLTSVVDNTTIPSPATSLLVFNTNANLPKGTGFYFNANTPAQPSWKRLSEWQLPINKTFFNSGTAFQIENYQGGVDAIAIKGYAAGIGTGIQATSEKGIALMVHGKMQIFGNGQLPLAGKVLTSSPNGYATWEGAVAFNARGVKGGGSEKIGAAWSKIPFANEEYDLQNNYTNADEAGHSTFTAPVKGIYHFNVVVSWKEEVGEPDTDHETWLALKKKSAGIESDLIVARNFLPGGNEATISAEVQLESGDQVNVHFHQAGYDYLYLRTEPESANFNGKLVVTL